ncbi:hypothetical protein BDY19DRAFT_879347 [Irpex rosettiformis]|uniref:Uncharacterized protein n=1 Tax=Irpex rosettiformis TaxID=378272 RepID=A0ACB8UL65_9APHY|nr:hypothetical protein BDY19DRAFT_879347 [Irpex rosettiformis]
MRNGTAPRSIPARRAQRADAQEGPWTISVAETPHDISSYSLYVRTPTHNLTLTRTAVEIVGVHGKLRDTLPGYKLPQLPLDASSLSPPPKRKSNFLNTLSRLASPAGKSSARQASGRPSSSAQPSLSETSTPVASPSKELTDPFAPFSSTSDLANAPDSSLENTNNLSTKLAAYLTSLANDSTVRQMRAWKRFVRVRTDDLQSVRTERAIKRVRSDLAAHSSPSTEGPRSLSQVLNDAEVATTTSAEPIPTVVPSLEIEPVLQDQVDLSTQVVLEQNVEHEVKEEDKDKDKDEEDGVAKLRETASATVQDDVDGEMDITSDARGKTPTPPLQGTEVDDDVNGRSTPVPSEIASVKPSRITRSQSAEPTSRVSRIYSTSVLRDGASSTTSITEDDSSISTTGRRSRKKRSKSTDPNASLEKKKSQRKVVVDDFEMMRVLGKGCAGKVLLVRHKNSSDVYALKAITKRHVLAHQELQHTLTEQAVLKRMAAEGTDPFVVKLWWSFHDKEHLFLVMDFHPGGDLATQLARWGRLGRDRARFYAAEIVEGVEGLHAAGVIYRDLKPENILIGADGHIVLTDFGLSKEFPRRTSAITAPSTPSGSRNEFLSGTTTPVAASPPWMKGEGPQTNPWTGANDTTTTFCGTAEYLAPEVIQGLPYSYEVDWWSFGTMLFEMLTGITPFWANNHSDMYYRVLQDELQFPDDKAMDQDTKSLIRGLLQRNPALRMKEPRIKKHPYFGMIEWSHVYHKRYIPPYIPPIDPSNASDTQNFDDTFLDMEPVIKDEDDGEQTDTDPQTDNERTDGEDSATTPSQSRSSSVHPQEEDDTLFDGYSFKGRHSVIIDDEEEEEEEEEGDESGEEEEEEEGSSVVTAELDVILHPKALREDVISSSDVSGDITTVDEVPEPEPTTPEATAPFQYEEGETAVDSITPVEAKCPEPSATAEAITSTDLPTGQSAIPAEKPIPPTPSAPIMIAQETIVIKAPVPRGTGRTRARREKSGIPALDRAYAGEESAAERDEEDDDWDFVETNVDEERNGSKPTSLFARGVVDRYKLAVFRKSTPRRSETRRNVSSISTDLGNPSDSSPTPTEKRRGRNPGLTFRRNPKEFLRAKSPPRTPTSAQSSMPPSASATLSAASTFSTSALLTPSPSAAPSLPVTPSLKSKESAISVGAPSEFSDQSANGELRTPLDLSRAASTVNIEEKQKSKGLKKYKEGAEKVLSIFQSPR